MRFMNMRLNVKFLQVFDQRNYLSKTRFETSLMQEILPKHVIIVD